MANMAIGYSFTTWDAATITSSSALSSNPDSNVVHDKPGKKWITSTDSNEWIVLDLGAASGVTQFGMFGHNLTASATVNLQGHSSDSWGAPNFTAAMSIASDADSVVFPRIVYYPPDATPAQQFWRVTIDDPTNPDTEIRVGRLTGTVSPTYYQADRNWSDGLRIARVDPSEGNNIPGEVSNWNQLNKFRRMRLDFSLADQAQVDKLDAIFSHCGNTRPMVITKNTAERVSQDSMYCYMITDLEEAHRMVDQFDVVTLLFEEKTR